MYVTDCECTSPGWCERHQCIKSRHGFELCRRQPEFFRAWENGILRYLCQQGRRNTRETPCKCRGPELRRASCGTCRGNVQIKVFSCGVYAECVLGNAIEGLKSCALCESYQAQIRPEH